MRRERRVADLARVRALASEEELEIGFGES